MKGTWRFVAAFAIVLAWKGSAAAQTVVVGTGNPDIDVLAVQTAVDQGGDIILKGHFSFDIPPTVPTAVGGLATVLVWKAVAISGTQDGDDDMASIEEGTTPSMSKLRELVSRFRDCALSARKGTRFLYMRPAD